MRTPHLDWFRSTAWLICCGCLWLAALTAVRAGGIADKTPRPVTQKKSAPAAQKPAASPANPNATYVGADICATCHDAENTTYAKTPHHRAMDPRTPEAKQSCETCHGPGSEHVQDPTTQRLRDFKAMPPAEVNAVCASCHDRGEHALWDGSAHEARGLSCVSCHSVHHFESETAQLKKKTQMELCAPCHRDKVSNIDRSGHMPVRENKMQCTTCHNVHGTTNVKLLRAGDSVTGLCTKCHPDKRGPFLWEHAPVSEGCTTCHDPHGSPNERMLVAKLPILCQRCHVSTRHPSTIYDSNLLTTSNRLYARSCVTCHANIHGSNHPAGQFFLR